MPSAHNVVSGLPGHPDGRFTADFGTKTCIRFDEPGSYPFFCGPHRFTGVIVVE
jgi:plastocyanin